MEMISESSHEVSLGAKWIWCAYLCFLTFGVIAPFSKSSYSLITFILSICIALCMGILEIVLLKLTFAKCKGMENQQNSDFSGDVVGTGMLFMIPFTILALVALVFLKWNAITPFISGAITTSAATVGAEAMKKGAKGVKNVIIPTFIATIVSTVWMLTISILP